MLARTLVRPNWYRSTPKVFRWCTTVISYVLVLCYDVLNEFLAHCITLYSDLCNSFPFSIPRLEYSLWTCSHLVPVYHAELLTDALVVMRRTREDWIRHAHILQVIMWSHHHVFVYYVTWHGKQGGYCLVTFIVA